MDGTDRRTPDMTGKASKIDDPMKLYPRVGYHVYRKHLAELAGAAPKVAIYEGYIKTELRRLMELNPKIDEA